MGLDIYIHKMLPPPTEKADKRGIIDARDVETEDVSVFGMSNKEYERAVGIPKGFVFKCRFHYYNVKAIFESTSTEKNPRSWKDGWHVAGWGYDGNGMHIDYMPSGSDAKWSDHVAVRVSKEMSEDPKFDLSKVEYAFLYSNEELGYQRKGENSLLYPAFRKGLPSIVFTKKELRRYGKEYFTGDDNPFKANIIDKFKDGEHMFVFFYW